MKLQNFGIPSELPRKFPEIFGNSRIIFGNSGTQQEKYLTPLAQKKLAGIEASYTFRAVVLQKRSYQSL